MNMARRVAGVILMGLLMGCATAQTAGPRWELLGRRDVDFHVDHDVIEVGRAEGRFRELKFIVRGGAVEMYNVRVILGDGDTFSPTTRMVFERGEGRILNLPGDRRLVRRVEFVYRSLRGPGRRATVQLFGR
jgi:hypothetical protein